MDADATARLLEQAALQLIERDGVLAGLNLREVADVAGVNRGLVYHYFGSRRELLRAALSRQAEPRRSQLLVKKGPARFAHRVTRSVRGCVRHASTVRLVVLLLLDKDPDLTVMPQLEVTQERLREDIETGHVAADADPVALHTFLKSVNYGYVTSRNALAREFGLPVRELDARFEQLLERMCASLDGSGAAAADPASADAVSADAVSADAEQQP
ncbi:TetR/AcrR family transcriptional regulator [Streptomyces sp. NPDC055189]